ncbi:MAG: cytochrome c3 family protein [Bryobacteraceae bacterium]|nr:cytochrome c family protein [Bryobacterales bacterium]MEB2362019.1 cytochrome c3 family protein [Bryobacterales bacterium]NUN01992.1 cytochrome c3 family protein [Bryobacteraceae bacterium]
MKHSGKIAFAAGLLLALHLGWRQFPDVLYSKADQPLQFSHKVHVEDSGMSCEDCHFVRDDGRFTGIPPIAKCAECHAEPLGATPHEKVLVEKYVATLTEIPWRVYSRQPDNVYFPHAAHVKTAKLACESCHGEHGKTENLRPYEQNRISGYSRDIWGPSISRISLKGERLGMKMDDCIDCHTEKKLRHSCLDCHK